jgi:type IV fimbrial biogenesis protein FimT
MKPTRALTRSPAGLTLVELLMTVAVLGVLLAVAIPSLMDLMERRRIVAVAGEVVSIFNYAKSEANALPDTLTMNLQPNTAYSCIRVNTSASYDGCRCTVSPADACKTGTAVMLREFLLPRSSTVSFAASGTWNAKPYTMTFERNRHHSDVRDVKITVTGARTGAKLRVDYNDAGRVSICAPDATMSGFPSCA